MSIGPTRQAVRQGVSRRTGVHFTGTADSSGGTTTNFADTNEPIFASSGTPARSLAGGWILPTSGSEKDERMITTMASAGNATVSPAWTGAQNSVTYEYHSIAQPSIITRAVRDACRRLRFAGFIYPSLVVDGDMEYSDTSAWSSSNAALTKSTEAGHLNFAQQSLRVANSAANGYAQSAQIPVSGPSELFEIWAMVLVDVGTATLRAYDNTNAATIASVSTSGEAWQWLRLDATVPSGCRDLRIRLIGTESTTDAYWNLVLVRRQWSNRFALPYWLQTLSPAPSPHDIIGVERLYIHGQTVSTDAYEADVLQTLPVGRWKLDSHPNSVDWMLTLPQNHTGPIRVKMYRPIPDPDDDTDTIPVAQDVIEAEAILELFKIKMNQEVGADKPYWERMYQNWLKSEDLARARAHYQRNELPVAWGQRR